MVAAVDGATLEANIRCAGGMIGAMQWLPPQGITKWLTEGIFSPLFNPVSPEASDGSYLISSSPKRERWTCVWEKVTGSRGGKNRHDWHRRAAQIKCRWRRFPWWGGQLERAPAIGTQAGGTQSTRAAPGPIGRQEENVSRGLYCHFCRKKERGGTNALRTGEFE